MKYVIFENRIPVVFCESINHDDMARFAKPLYGEGKPTSAGFIYVKDDGETYTTGRSVSLDIESRKDDIDIIEKYLKRIF